MQDWNRDRNMSSMVARDSRNRFHDTFSERGGSYREPQKEPSSMQYDENQWNRNVSSSQKPRFQGPSADFRGSKHDPKLPENFQEDKGFKMRPREDEWDNKRTIVGSLDRNYSKYDSPDIRPHNREKPGWDSPAHEGKQQLPYTSKWGKTDSKMRELDSPGSFAHPRETNVVGLPSNRWPDKPPPRDLSPTWRKDPTPTNKRDTYQDSSSSWSTKVEEGLTDRAGPRGRQEGYFTNSPLSKDPFLGSNKNPSFVSSPLPKDPYLERNKNPSFTNSPLPKDPYLGRNISPSFTNAPLPKDSYLGRNISPSFTNAPLAKDPYLGRNTSPSFTKAHLPKDPYLGRDKSPSFAHNLNPSASPSLLSPSEMRSNRWPEKLGPRESGMRQRQPVALEEYGATGSHLPVDKRHNRWVDPSSSSEPALAKKLDSSFGKRDWDTAFPSAKSFNSLQDRPLPMERGQNLPFGNRNESDMTRSSLYSRNRSPDRPGPRDPYIGGRPSVPLGDIKPDPIPRDYSSHLTDGIPKSLSTNDFEEDRSEKPYLKGKVQCFDYNHSGTPAQQVPDPNGVNRIGPDISVLKRKLPSDIYDQNSPGMLSHHSSQKLGWGSEDDQIRRPPFSDRNSRQDLTFSTNERRRQDLNIGPDSHLRGPHNQSSDFGGPFGQGLKGFPGQQLGLGFKNDHTRGDPFSDSKFREVSPPTNQGIRRQDAKLGPPGAHNLNVNRRGPNDKLGDFGGPFGQDKRGSNDKLGDFGGPFGQDKRGPKSLQPSSRDAPGPNHSDRFGAGNRANQYGQSVPSKGKEEFFIQKPPIEPPPHEAIKEWRRQDNSTRSDPSRGGQKDPHRGSQKDPPRGSQKDPPRGSQKDPPRGSQRDPPRGSQKDPPRGSQKDSPRGSQKDSPRGSQKDPPRGSQKDPPRGSQKDPPRGSQKDPPRGSQKDPPRDSQKDPPRGNHKDKGPYKWSNPSLKSTPNQASQAKKEPVKETQNAENTVKSIPSKQATPATKTNDQTNKNIQKGPAPTKTDTFFGMKIENRNLPKLEGTGFIQIVNDCVASVLDSSSSSPGSSNMRNTNKEQLNKGSTPAKTHSNRKK